jgi:hypothetical protein
MPVLGNAIARYLSSLRGLYTVELPEALGDEMVTLVQRANTAGSGRALLVSSGAAPAGLESATIAPRQLLAWRTDEDRVFVWRRGTFEPDSSFQSVARPFISRRFPGADGGECDLPLLVRASITELWDRRSWPLVGDVFEAFLDTADWVTDVLRTMFASAGSSLVVGWSDRFLQHLASMLDELDARLTAYHPNQLVPRHAWEVVRISGLPLPSALAKNNSNPFLERPGALQSADAVTLVALWEEIASSYLLPETIAEFLLALDLQSLGTTKISPWRDLDWTKLDTVTDAPAPVVGASIFGASPSPSLLSATIPNTSAPDRPSWWGVATRDLEQAREHLRRVVPLTPDPARPLLLPVAPTASAYVLDTRAGIIAFAHTPKRWKARISMSGLGLRYKEDWNTLHVADAAPTTGADGDAWIVPGAIELSMRGCTVSQLVPTRSPGNQLLLSFDLLVEYTAAIDQQTHDLNGSWSAERKLKLAMDVSLRHGGVWQPSKRVDTDIRVTIPSPFAPTVIVVEEGKLGYVGPDGGDDFVALNAASTMWAAETPTITLDSEGRFGVRVYDGVVMPWTAAFRGLGTPVIGGHSLGILTAGLSETHEDDLDDGYMVADASNTHGGDVAVFSVKQRSNSLSSGILAAVRGQPAGRRAPGAAARSSVLGRFQDSVTPALCTNAPSALDSLYQQVITTAATAVASVLHAGGPAPTLLFDYPAGFALPGIGNGPTPALCACPEFATFVGRLGEVCAALGLRPGTESSWLSGLDPSRVPANVIRALLQSHGALLEAAAGLGKADRFWAAYPLSVIVVDGDRGPNFGQVRAVFLSPLHPVRLAWGFSVSAVARKVPIDHGLLGLLEGWNLPTAGVTVNAAGDERWMVAVPIDSGEEQDFIGWSALAVLGAGGTAELPVMGAGQQLPWGGRTGINARVVDRALRDYLDVHSHVNALEVDVRSIGESPRSHEIDETLLDLLGAGDLKEVSFIGGGVRIWDSDDRKGLAPTRDALFAGRRTQETSRSFEWRLYPSNQPPPDADIAFIENATVHLAIADSATHGLIGDLPLRRFLPADQTSTQLDQHFLPTAGEDVLGVASLLRLLESPSGSPHLSIRARPQVHALGIGRGAQWEVLGTFNIAPSLLASLVASAPAQSGRRLLWEWRPSWMVAEKKTNELARRPYYVVARVPKSLAIALHSRQAISQANAEELLSLLGQKGIGLAALMAQSDTQESAAAGFFYATQLLSSNKTPGPFDGLPPNIRPLVYGVLPLDPIEPILQGLAGRPLKRRADMLALAVSQDANGTFQLCLVPAEIKHHGSPLLPGVVPPANHKDLLHAREQLSDTVALIQEIVAALAGTDPGGAPLRYLKRVGLSTLVDLAMSLSSAPIAGPIRAAVLKAVLSGELRIGVGDPILLWFAPGCIATAGSACLVDPHAPHVLGGLQVREVYMDTHHVPGLWWSTSPLLPPETQARNQVDLTIRSAFAKCASTSKQIPSDRNRLSELLGLNPSPSTVLAPTPPATSAPEAPTEASPPEAPSGDQTGAQSMSPPNAPPVTETPPMHGESAQLTVEVPTAPAPVPAVAAPDPTAPATAHPTPVQPLIGEQPRAVIGWSSLGARWAAVGRLPAGGELIALDLDHPKTLGIFGYMGSGKSYLLGNIVESALVSIPGINSLPAPLAVVIFNYRRNAADRFELASLAYPNDDPADVERLASEYHASPVSTPDAHVLCLPGELRPARLQEYAPLGATELFFDPSTLDVEDWELLMGEPGSDAVFARTIRSTLMDMRTSGEVTLEQFDSQVAARLTGQSRSAARLRFDFVRRYISEDRGVDFAELVRPGRALIVDLRQPLFNKDDALRFFLVCANQISRIQGRFNKMLVFDEAHEYLSEAFGERMESRIRQMRHEGTSYVFATQDVGSIPSGISRFMTTRFVFNVGTRENVQDLEAVAPEFRGFRLLDMRPGHCFVQANTSTQGLFAKPREVKVRPRVTRHGGGSRIFSGTDD